MFETVSPEAFRPRSRKLFYESLPVSIGLHAAAVGGFVFFSTLNVVFPTNTPRMVTLFQLEALPTPPPPPPPPPAAPMRKILAPQQVRLPDNVAPPFIPDEVIPVQPQTAAIPVEGIDTGVEGGVAGSEGDFAGGVEGGEVGGVVGGVVGAVVAEVQPPPDTVVVKRDMPLPTAPLSMVYPQYPENARIRGWEDVVLVRYVIGTNGRVREVTVLNKPERQLFTDLTIRAIRNWRFRPFKKDGVAQEIIHELTVIYKLEKS
jgi:periplasmic protein TonB